jgi:hypothetical protein
MWRVARRGVFISHSCNERRSDDPATLDPEVAAHRAYARDLRARLVARLTAEVGEGCAWYDARAIRAGDDWEQKIIEALHTCAAAVILVTPEALSSPWVLRESIVLVDRKLRNPDLVIVPIYLAGVRPETLAADRLWDTTRLTHIQGIVPIDASADDVATQAAEDAAANAVDVAVPQLVAATKQAGVADELPRWARNLDTQSAA